MKKIWNNFLTSGFNPLEVEAYYLNQIKFFNYFSVVGITSALLFGFAHVISENITIGIFEFTGAFLAILNVLYLRVSSNYQAASRVLLLTMIVILVFLLYTGGLQGTGIFWFYTFPSLAFFLKGKLYGFFYLIFLYFVTIVSYLLYHYKFTSQFFYSFIEIRQMLSSLTAVSLLVYYYEKTRENNEEVIKQSEKEVVVKNIFNRQLEEAGEIQRTYIPQNTLFSEYMQIAGYYKPAMEIGGDYFDIFPLDSDRTGVIICDVSSKGIPAALIMVKFRTMIKMIFNMETYKPSQLLSYLNKIIAKEIAGHMFITAMYLIINQKKSEVEFTNAGHLPMTIYSFEEKKIVTINSNDFPIGISEDQNFKDRNRKLLPGDIIILYTDGINETVNQQKVMYGTERLHKEIIKHSESSAKEISNHLIKDIFLFKKGANQNDDIALVVIKIQKNI